MTRLVTEGGMSLIVIAAYMTTVTELAARTMYNLWGKCTIKKLRRGRFFSRSRRKLIWGS